jgi:hypothetical protein
MSANFASVDLSGLSMIVSTLLKNFSLFSRRLTSSNISAASDGLSLNSLLITFAKWS